MTDEGLWAWARPLPLSLSHDLVPGPEGACWMLVGCHSFCEVGSVIIQLWLMVMSLLPYSQA